MNKDINIILNSNKVTVKENTKVEDLLKEFDKSHEAVAVKVNNVIVGFNEEIKANDKVEFVNFNTRVGNKIYVSGLKFILIVAVKELYQNNIEVYFEHSIDKGLCCVIDNYSSKELDINKIKAKMQEIIDRDIPFKKITVEKKDAIRYFNQINEIEKALNIQSISNQFITLYNLNGYYNYFYNDMPYSTKYLSIFDLISIENNKFVLLFPVTNGNKNIPEYHHYPLNMQAFSTYNEWIRTLRITDISDINYLVSHNEISDFIRTNELYLQKNILKEAENIYLNENIKIVLIAGPSCSGKTTTSKKLSLALKAYGKEIFNISTDDYYLNQSQMPNSLIKKRDFESIDLIDIKLLNEHLEKLMNQEEVRMPIYDFTTGVKEFSKNPVRINDNTIIIIEGIHALNDLLFTNINDSIKYKLYISPFEPLSIDRHNHMSTVDLRLLRRLVRDNMSRGVSVEETIKSWQYVRKGEEKYIFPFMGRVNSVLNTSLAYEIGVLKVYAEPLLYSVAVSSPSYDEAQRLIEFLKPFYPIPSEYVEKSSLLREFIGGSIFK